MGSVLQALGKKSSNHGPEFGAAHGGGNPMQSELPLKPLYHSVHTRKTGGSGKGGHQCGINSIITNILKIMMT